MELESKKNLVDKIISSHTFSNKEVLKGLLNFLFKATEQGLNLKEIDIAFDYFKRKGSFVPGDDTIVRVNIHNLRQLLEKYSSEEGKEQKIKLQIPKGSYNVVFENDIKPVEPSKKRNTKISTLILSIILAISLLINIFLTHDALNKINKSNNPVWGTFMKSNKQISIILGDPFFFSKKDSTGKNIISRDLEINSAEDLASKYDNSVQKSKYAYFSKNNVLPLADILAVLASNNKTIDLQALSEVNPENLKNSNQIFIANINSLGFFGQYLEKTSIRVFLNPRKIGVIVKSDTTYYQVKENVGDFYNDYSLMVKIPGPNNNTIVMMGDFHSSGNKGLAGFLKDELEMKTLEKFAIGKYGVFPEYFEMLLRTSSYHYSDVKTELIYFNKLTFNVENPHIRDDIMN